MSDRVKSKRKLRNIAREARRAKIMKCGHGSRHASKYDEFCCRCWGEGKTNRALPPERP